MKKTPWIGLGMTLFLGGVLRAQSIIVTSPQAGDKWCAGSTHTITWNSSGQIGEVAIKLRPQAGSLINIKSSMNNTGSFSWTIPVSVAAGTYRVRVRTVSEDPFIYDDSADFEITSPSQPPPPPPPDIALKVLSPDGGESWLLGSERTISWTSTNLTGKVYLQLVRYNDRTLGTIKDNLPAVGSVTWKAGEYPGNTAPAGKYVIRVRSMADFKVFDESDAPFHLTQLVKQFKKPVTLNASISKKASITNWLGQRTFPGNVSPPIPLSVFSSRPVCDPGINNLALVGAEWFQYASNVRAASLRRSKLVFPLGDLLGKGAELKKAVLKLKRVSCVCNGDFRVASCLFNIEVLQGPWTKFFSAPGYWIGGTDAGSGEVFSKDVTETVRKWLDGSEDYHHGLLLIGDEAATSKNFACFSCFEASLVLTMK